MADVVNFGTIGAVYLLRLGSSDDTLDGKRHNISCLSIDMRLIVEWIHI